MAVTVTVAKLAAAMRVGSSDEETAEVTRLLALAATVVVKHAPDAPDAIHNEAAIRFAGYQFDRPTAPAGPQYANALRNSGAEALLLPWRKIAGGVVGEAEAAPTGDTPAAAPTGNVDAFQFRAKPTLSATDITTDTAIPISGAGPTVTLLDAAEIPGPIAAGVDFFTFWQGYIELEVGSHANALLRLHTQHAFGAGFAKVLDHVREVHLDAVAGTRQSVSLGVFNSFSQVAVGTYNLPGGGSVEITEADLAAPSKITYALEVQSAERKTETRNANTLKALQFHGPGVISYQLRQAVQTVVNQQGGDTPAPSGPAVDQTARDAAAANAAAIAAILQLPTFPDAGSRDGKVAKFDGDVLGWEPDAEAAEVDVPDKAVNADVDAIVSTGAELSSSLANSSVLNDDKYLTVRKAVRALARVLKKASMTARGVVLMARSEDVEATETDVTRVPNIDRAKRLIARLAGEAAARALAAVTRNSKLISLMQDATLRLHAQKGTPELVSNLTDATILYAPAAGPPTGTQGVNRLQRDSWTSGNRVFVKLADGQPRNQYRIRFVGGDSVGGEIYDVPGGHWIAHTETTEDGFTFWLAWPDAIGADVDRVDILTDDGDTLYSGKLGPGIVEEGNLAAAFLAPFARMLLHYQDGLHTGPFNPHYTVSIQGSRLTADSGVSGVNSGIYNHQETGSQISTGTGYFYVRAPTAQRAIAENKAWEQDASLIVYDRDTGDVLAARPILAPEGDTDPRTWQTSNTVLTKYATVFGFDYFELQVSIDAGVRMGVYFGRYGAFGAGGAAPQSAAGAAPTHKRLGTAGTLSGTRHQFTFSDATEKAVVDGWNAGDFYAVLVEFEWDANNAKNIAHGEARRRPVALADGTTYQTFMAISTGLTDGNAEEVYLQVTPNSTGDVVAVRGIHDNLFPTGTTCTLYGVS